MANSPVQALPDQLEEPFRAAFEERERTVYDARALLRPYRTSTIRLVVDAGEDPCAPRWGIYQRVVHRPDVGFGLALKGLLPAKDPRIRHLPRHRDQRTKTTTLWLPLIHELPGPFRFLRGSREEWPMPPVFAPCTNEGCGYAANVGRFCVRCGTLVRRGPREGNLAGRKSDFLGEGFAALQTAKKAVRDDVDLVRGCSECGAQVYPSWERFCPKCGVAVASP